MPSQKTPGGKTAFLFGMLVFAIFVVNLVMTGILKKPPFISDVVEMLLLFVAVGFFVMGILQREADVDELQ